MSAPRCRHAGASARSWRAKLLAVSLAALPALADAAGDAPGWMPPPVESGIADELLARLRALGGEQPTGSRLPELARRLTRSLRDSVGARSVPTILAAAPAFPAAEVPALADPLLDGMQRYMLCSVLLLRQLDHPDFADDFNARFTAAVGLSAITTVMLRLREPFVARGGTHAAMEAALTRPALEPMIQAVQLDAAVRTRAEALCQPVVVDLLAAPLATFTDIPGDGVPE